MAKDDKNRYLTKNSADSLKTLDKLAGIPLTFGSALKANRLAEEMSQSELGAKIGVSRQYIHQLETGNRNPSVEQAVRIAKVFGMPEDQFVELALQVQVEKAGLQKAVVLKKVI